MAVQSTIHKLSIFLIFFLTRSLLLLLNMINHGVLTILVTALFCFQEMNMCVCACVRACNIYRLSQVN